MKHKIGLAVGGLAMSLGLLCTSVYAATTDAATTDAATTSNSISIEKQWKLDGQFIPEGIAYDAASQSYFLGSLTEPTIYRIGANKEVKRFAYDKEVISSAGLHVDANHRRLLVTSLDLGTSEASIKGKTGAKAGLAVYSLETEEKIAYVDLSTGLAGGHVSNDLTFDTAGNIYITDSFSPVIYKVDTDYKVSILIQDPAFAGEGFNLNGIVFHPDGYLIVSKYNSNSLYTIPLNNPKNWSKIELATTLSGPDGLVLLNNKELAVIENKTRGNISILRSENNWESAELKSALLLESAFPTTAALANGKLVVLDGHINQLFAGKKDEVNSFTLYQILTNQ